MIATPEELLRELRARGVTSDGPANASPTHPASDRPWYIGLLLGASGWVAGIFVLVFVFMLVEPRSSATTLGIGVVLLAAAWGLFAADREGAFVSQLALALSVAGQFAALFGAHDLLFKASRGIASVALVALVLELGLIAAISNRLHRTMSTLFACTAWALLVRYGMWDEPRWNLGSRGSLPESPTGFALAGWLIVWLPVAWMLWRSVRTEASWMAAGRQTIMRPACTGLIVGLAMATVFSYPLDSFVWDASVRHAKNWLALWPLLSAFAALGALAAAVALGSRWLIGVCVVASLLHLAHFYYAMGISLVAKSVTMLLLGALLLLAVRYMRRPSPP